MLAICKDDRIGTTTWDGMDHRTGLRVLCLGDKRIGIAEMTSRFAQRSFIPGLVRAQGRGSSRVQPMGGSTADVEPIAETAGVKHHVRLHSCTRRSKGHVGVGCRRSEEER
jgi:hypothetical protein